MNVFRKAPVRRSSYNELDKMTCPMDASQPLSPTARVPVQRVCMSNVAVTERRNVTLVLNNMDSAAPRLRLPSAQ